MSETIISTDNLKSRGYLLTSGTINANLTSPISPGQTISFLDVDITGIDVSRIRVIAYGNGVLGQFSYWSLLPVSKQGYDSVIGLFAYSINYIISGNTLSFVFDNTLNNNNVTNVIDPIIDNTVIYYVLVT